MILEIRVSPLISEIKNIYSSLENKAEFHMDIQLFSELSGMLVLMTLYLLAKQIRNLSLIPAVFSILK